jgi:hypothetical protein
VPDSSGITIMHDSTDGNPIPVADLALDFPDTVRRSKFKGLWFTHTSFESIASFDEAFKVVVADKEQRNATRRDEPVSAIFEKGRLLGGRRCQKRFRHAKENATWIS